jgi:hypothetical protein
VIQSVTSILLIILPTNTTNTNTTNTNTTNTNTTNTNTTNTNTTLLMSRRLSAT